MDYNSTIKIIKKMETFGSKPGLERTKKLLNMVGDPQKKLRCIHVAGTNGKGSTCFMLGAILSEAGYKVGRYISPDIQDYRERFTINGEKISEQDFIDIVEYFKPYLNQPCFKDDSITEFEMATAIAFKFFEKNNCDVVILETGIGGKWDATNVIEKPICSVLTSIDFDHTKILGETIEKITLEKCGIIKKNQPVVIADNQMPCVYEITKKISQKLRSNMFKASKSELEDIKYHELGGITFKYKGMTISTPILGEHQIINISCVLKVIDVISESFSVSKKHIQKAMKNLKIPCRLEYINHYPGMILDACHNPQGTKSLSDFLRKNLKDKNIFGIVGMFKDKDYDTSLKNLSGIFKKIFTVNLNSPRSESLENITICAKKYFPNVSPCENLQKALTLAKSVACSEDIIVIFGSFSLMKEFKNIKKTK